MLGDGVHVIWISSFRLRDIRHWDVQLSTLTALNEREDTFVFTSDGEPAMSVYRKDFQELIAWLDEGYINRLNAVECFSWKINPISTNEGESSLDYIYDGFVHHLQGTISLHGHTNEMLHGIVPVNHIIENFNDDPPSGRWIQLAVPYPIPVMHLTVIFTTPAIFRLEFFGGVEDGKVVETNQVANHTDPIIPDQHIFLLPDYHIELQPMYYAIRPKGGYLRINPTIPQPQPKFIPGPKPRLDRQ
jgi:hypothetical protein